MRLRVSISGFSLIELLVALAILAVVAGVIVPRFLNITKQASQTVIDANLKEISNATQMWQSLGGQRANLGINRQGEEAAKLLQFLSSTTNLGTDAKRGFNSTNGYTESEYPTDSLGAGGSWTVTVNATVADTTGGASIASSSSDGLYIKAPNANAGSYTQNGAALTAGQIITIRNDKTALYSKTGSQVDQVGTDLATMIFIRTGVTITLNN